MEEDILFAAITRPAMIAGVTYTGLLLNMMVTVILFIGFNRISLLLVFLPIHILMYVICWKEPRYFEIFKVWFITKGASRARNIWKSSTYGH